MATSLPKKIPFRREHTGDPAIDRAQRMGQQLSPAVDQIKAATSSLLTRATALEVASLCPSWSPAIEGASLGVTATAGDFTTGVQFSVGRSVKCTGLRFYGVASASKLVRAKLYNAAGTLLTSAFVTISSSGTYLVSWKGVALVPFALYRVCVYQTDTLNYYAYALANANPPARPFYAGGVCVYNNIALFFAGDTSPIATAGSEAYPIEPVLSL